MKRKAIAGVIVFVAGFIAAFLLMGYYNTWTEQRNAEESLPASDIRPTAAVPDNAPMPSVSIDAFVDSADGYNLNLVTNNFIFSPGLVGEGRTPSTGYAMVYINDRPHARVYAPWHHISLDDLAQGQNTIEVYLMSNDHAEWVADGEPIMDAVMLEKVR